MQSILNLEQYTTTAKNISRNKFDCPNRIVHILFESTIVFSIQSATQQNCNRLNLEQYTTTAKNISRNKFDFPNLFVHPLFESTIVFSIQSATQ